MGKGLGCGASRQPPQPMPGATPEEAIPNTMAGKCPFAFMNRAASKPASQLNMEQLQDQMSKGGF